MTGEVQEAHVFVGILCFSQLIFAYACENEKKENWLLISSQDAGILQWSSPRVLVCDQLKNGVSRSHLYDPDLNPDYVEFAKHYGTAIVPARVNHPKDKSLVEGAVKLVSRLFRWLYRRHTFTSLEEINQALRKTVEMLNNKIHTRFRISRKQRFLELEKEHLKALPIESYEQYSWKTAVVHPDCTVSVERNFYSAPHMLRGKELRVKISPHQVELFLDLERVALHTRIRGRVGSRVIDLAHLPKNSRAHRETTPQNLLHQAKFIHSSLYCLLQELFEQDTLVNIRRVQGIVRHAYQVIQHYGRAKAEPWVEGAIAQMKYFSRIRVNSFEEFIKQEQKKVSKPGRSKHCADPWESNDQKQKGWEPHRTNGSTQPSNLSLST